MLKFLAGVAVGVFIAPHIPPVVYQKTLQYLRSM